MSFVRPLVFVAAIGCSVAIATLAAQKPSAPPSPAAIDLAARLIAASEAARAAILSDRENVSEDLARGLSVQASSLMNAQRLDEALQGYVLMQQVGEAAGLRRMVGAAFIGIGTIYGRRGEYPEAVRKLREGLAIDEELNDAVNTGAALNNLGIISRRQGEYDEALAYYNRALTLYEKVGQSDNISRTLANVGNIHLMRGSYRQALQYFERSLQLKEQTKQAADIPSSLNAIGSVHERMGDLDLALDFFQRSAARAAEAGFPAAAAPSLRDAGRIYARQRKYDLSLEYQRRALALFEASGERAEIAETLQSLGDAYRKQNDLARAQEYFERSLALREDVTDRVGTADVLVDLAQVLYARRDWPRAREAVSRALRIAVQAGNREILWQARLVEGRILEAITSLSDARDAYRDAIETVEELREDALASEQDRQRFFEEHLEPYQRLATLLAADGRPADALAIAERAKARVLLDALRSGRADTRLLTIDERERERTLERAAAAAHARVQAEAAKDKPDDRTLGTLRTAYTRARNDVADFRDALYMTHPVLKLSRGDAEPASLDDAAEVAQNPRTAIVEFVVGPDATCLFVIGRTGADATPTLQSFTIRRSDADLRADVERFRKQLADRDLDFQQTARDLYRRLLLPARAALQGRTNLIIVPDGPLWDLPFQALQPAPDHYLIEDAAISFAPSIAVLREIRARGQGRAPANPPTLVAFGNPEAPGADAGRVPETVRQVQRLEDVYGARQSQIFVGDRASAERFVSAPAPTVLHVATHGVLDDASPMYSFLKLAGKENGDAAHDGRLEAWEIMKLNLRASVTVLAACETARGHIAGGEGVIGLSWAFFLAGSPRTVVSLWNVDAASTADLMLAFHRRLHAELVRQPNRPDVAASLRAASLSMLRDPRYRHPFYWAGFLVVGDGS